MAGIDAGSRWVCQRFAPFHGSVDINRCAGKTSGRAGLFPLERSGKKVRLADLRGQVWIADFIYTNCTDTCPLQTADMAKLQGFWMKQSVVQLVSFSVDPERDTPAILSRYANRFKADPKRWLFLTGDQRDIAHLVEDGFHLAVAPAPHGNYGIILHSPRFVLVDQRGQIRGYYDNRDSNSMQRLHDDVANLLSQSPPARELSRQRVLTH